MKNLIIILFLNLLFLTSCEKKDVEVKTEKVSIPTPVISPTLDSSSRLNSSVTPKPKKKISLLNAKLGSIETGKQGICLKIPNDNLKIGDKVQVVLTEKPQKVIISEILEKKECKGDDYGSWEGIESETGSFYEEDFVSYLLKPLQNVGGLGFAIGIIDSPEIKIEDGLAKVDIDNDGKEEYFRECTGEESLHLMVWRGKPLIGKRVWKSYYDFSYGTVPTCTKEDFK
ncbi:MAG: hypothetical protein MUC29_08160 [Pyrinomonadaceae bacterium]|jgi:hypothetical protein|nr:hypothetical protein [Pyrinomonadaceae bacterium]